MSEDFEVAETRPGAHKVTLRVGGEDVSWLTILDMKMHYGRSKISVGGIAGVCTAQDFRSKGYSRKTMEHAIEWMKTREYSLSALFGIQNYYDKFGFAVFICASTVTTSLSNIARIKPSAKHRVMLSENPNHRSKEVAQLYEENNVDRIASIVRDPESWKGFTKAVSWEHKPRVLVATAGSLLGYAVLERWPPLNAIVVAEVEARDHDYCVYSALLRRIYKIMRRESKSYLTLHVPPDHPIISVLSSHGCTLHIEYPASGGGMARVISLRRLLTEVRDELERRLGGFDGILCMCTPEEELTIGARNNHVELLDGAETENKVKLSWGEVAQLVLSYRDPVEIASSAETHGGINLLAKLFPKSVPYVWEPSRF